jgi:hypothetical protein
MLKGSPMPIIKRSILFDIAGEKNNLRKNKITWDVQFGNNSWLIAKNCWICSFLLIIISFRRLALYRWAGPSRFG